MEAVQAYARRRHESARSRTKNGVAPVALDSYNRLKRAQRPARRLSAKDRGTAFLLSRHVATIGIVHIPPAKDTLDYVSAISLALAAVGTLLAVIVALYLNLWRDSRKRPVLSLRLEDPNLAGGMGFQGDPEGPAAAKAVAHRPVRIRISNQKGRRTAQDVEVLLTALWIGEDGRPETFLDSTPLVWSPHHRVEGQGTQLAIPPGVGRTIDLLTYGLPPAIFVLAGAPNGPIDSGAFALLHIWPFKFNSQYLLLDHLQYQFRFVITARDLDARIYETTLSLGFHDEDGIAFVRFIELNWGDLQEVSG